MRLLVLSAFYPPHHLGGYELACEAAVEGLRGRGHDVEVLTTTFRTAAGQGEPERDGVARELELYWSDGAWRRPNLSGTIEATHRDVAAFQRAVARSRPDAVWVWHLAGVSKSLLVRAEELGVPVMLALHDLWPLYDTVDPWLRWVAGAAGVVGRSVARREGLPRVAPTLRGMAGASYNSAWTRDQLAGAGRTPDGPVIPPPVDPRFTPNPPPPEIRGFLHLGRIEPRKGPMVAVEALARAHAAGLRDATLTLAGASERGHIDEVLSRARALGVGEAVTYAGFVRREDVPELYRDHDAVVHSAVWEEPFGLTLVEAMASGRPVIASPTGGTLGIVAEGENALTFPKGDAAACARRMVELANDPALAARLVAAGGETASRYGDDAVVDAHERHLTETLEGYST
jgi:glycosyltransferase involved in cell wall biosynthesis